ncbi:SAM-dependent methyltransferase YrrT [Alkalibacterium sp. AK22]|uniref:class I SAM-dependent methyltransferase n=1 Tax=Alkalibacterium sp. AK22 TaxID=1229520 RepID=UPI000447248D|nr:class I SAM-dependent methyltransferase [Alkalibacterium sp. AK22]EXJ23411.1 SAM-dependent methyltransferase YrrT [Alkalibacterium sp. AK22]
MGREFLEVFSGWAEQYDSFVEGEDDQYREVFRGYDRILEEVVSRTGQQTIEFGIGTGNLTHKLIQAGRKVWAVEPSEEMRQLALTKLPKEVVIVDGDMQNYPKPPFAVDTIVSSYVFHHLTDDEKTEVLKSYAELLEPGGKVVFADTLFITPEARESIIEEAQDLRYDNLVEDLKREYYPLLSTVYSALSEAGFEDIGFKQMNAFVWIFEGTVKRTDKGE